MAQRAQFFETPAAFRTWLQKNHRIATELLVGFVKVHACVDGVRSITWQESVAEALCFGWIDGVRRRLDEERYVIRFTPRRERSRWSAINSRLVTELEAAGRMTKAGRAAFESRPHKTGPDAKGYSYERRDAELSPAYVREFRRHGQAWEFFRAQPPGYRKLVAWWVMSAKKEGTRQSRLLRLIQASRDSRRL